MSLSVLDLLIHNARRIFKCSTYCFSCNYTSALVHNHVTSKYISLRKKCLHACQFSFVSLITFFELFPIQTFCMHYFVSLHFVLFQLIHINKSWHANRYIHLLLQIKRNCDSSSWIVHWLCFV